MLRMRGVRIPWLHSWKNDGPHKFRLGTPSLSFVLCSKYPMLLLGQHWTYHIGWSEDWDSAPQWPQSRNDILRPVLALRVRLSYIIGDPILERWLLIPYSHIFWLRADCVSETPLPRSWSEVFSFHPETPAFVRWCQESEELDLPYRAGTHRPGFTLCPFRNLSRECQIKFCSYQCDSKVGQRNRPENAERTKQIAPFVDL